MIKTQNLTKKYQWLVAVDDLSFSVEPGEVLGFLGPNGAGKTTTMRMIAGFITPSAGSASICGHDVVGEPLAAKAAVGYLPEGAPTYGEMTVGRYLVEGEILPATVATVTSFCARVGVLPGDLQVGRRSLDDVYLELTGRGIRT